MMPNDFEAGKHPFQLRPNRTLLSLSLPILLSLIAEPVTGLVDTAFIARLGAVPLAALGVGTSALSSVFWIFGFLGIATQTEVAQAFGRGDSAAARKCISLALALGMGISLLLGIVLFLTADVAAALLGASGAVQMLATEYIHLRLLGAPAVIVVIIGFGALRGVQDMRSPMWIALGINLANILLDYLLIFGAAFIPPLGVAGAAIASTISQWLGALCMLYLLLRRLGFSREIQLRDGIRFLTVGRDLVLRSGSLVLFILFTTRVATQIGAEAGAAHQVIRQVWFFTALVLEAFATTAQSLVGYFFGSGKIRVAKEVALKSIHWSLATGLVLLLAMLLATQAVADVFVPADAAAAFHFAWIIGAVSQPLNALAFITDGIHWGTSDYRYLRNVMLAATVCGVLSLQAIDISRVDAFDSVWLATVLWIAIRAFWGFLRVRPGIGNSPLRASGSSQTR